MVPDLSQKIMQTIEKNELKTVVH